MTHFTMKVCIHYQFESDVKSWLFISLVSSVKFQKIESYIIFLINFSSFFTLQAINLTSSLFPVNLTSHPFLITLNSVENKKYDSLWELRSHRHATSFLPSLRCKKCIRKMIINSTFIFNTWIKFLVFRRLLGLSYHSSPLYIGLLLLRCSENQLLIGFFSNILELS